MFQSFLPVALQCQSIYIPPRNIAHVTAGWKRLNKIKTWFITINAINPKPILNKTPKIELEEDLRIFVWMSSPRTVKLQNIYIASPSIQITLRINFICPQMIPSLIRRYANPERTKLETISIIKVQKFLFVAKHIYALGNSAKISPDMIRFQLVLLSSIAV
jgi:hypothetical protein